MRIPTEPVSRQQQWSLRRPALPTDAEWPLKRWYSPSPLRSELRPIPRVRVAQKRAYRSGLPTLNEVIEQIGLGAAQVRVLFTAGGIFFADGAELLLISSVAQVVSLEWSLSANERGSLVTIVYLGMMTGNVSSGPISDRYGRRHVIIAAFMGIFVFSILSASAPSFAALAALRFFNGLSIGLGIPPVNVLASEFTPAKYRVMVNGTMQSLFSFGEMYSATLLCMDDPDMVNLHWRKLIILGSFPALVFGIAATICLPQSPFFLARSGQDTAAKEVLDVMRRDNCLPLQSVEFKADRPVQAEAQESFGSQIRRMGHGPYFATTLVLIFACFTLNFSFYGSLYAFPNVLPTLETAATMSSAGMDLFIGALWEILGNVIGIVVGMCFHRKPVMKINFLAISTCLLLFAVGASQEQTSFATVIWHVGYYGLKCLVSCQFVIVYVYASEVYPTVVRTTGCGLAFGSGRLAAMIAPLAYENLDQATGSFALFFYIMAACNFLNLLVIDFLPYETFGRALDEVDK